MGVRPFGVPCLTRLSVQLGCSRSACRDSVQPLAAARKRVDCPMNVTLSI